MIKSKTDVLSDLTGRNGEIMVVNWNLVAKIDCKTCADRNMCDQVKNDCPKIDFKRGFIDDVEYVIQSDEGFWSNDAGWVPSAPSTDGYFGKDITEYGYKLPVGKNVRWVERYRDRTVFENDKIKITAHGEDSNIGATIENKTGEDIKLILPDTEDFRCDGEEPPYYEIPKFGNYGLIYFEYMGNTKQALESGDFTIAEGVKA